VDCTFIFIESTLWTALSYLWSPRCGLPYHIYGVHVVDCPITFHRVHIVDCRSTFIESTLRTALSYLWSPRCRLNYHISQSPRCRLNYHISQSPRCGLPYHIYGVHVVDCKKINLLSPVCRAVVELNKIS